MITLNNYESWFMLYADNELSEEEQSHVIQFIQEHPELNEELEMLIEMKTMPDENIVYHDKSSLKEEHLLEMETGICFEPDMDIIYPNKQELYRQKSAPIVWWLRPLQAAAVVLVGLFWFVNHADDEAKKISSIPSNPKPNKSSFSQQKSNSFSEKVVVRIQPNKNLNKRLLDKSKIETHSNQTAMVTSNEQQTSVQVSDVATISIPEKHESNFTDDALKAAETRNITENASTETNPDTEILQTYQEPSKGRKSPLRGLFRKITRAVLNEKEENDGRNYVHVASFIIPITKTNNK